MNVEPVLCYVDECWAWFTTAPLDEQWGDDWDDAPYGYNAGGPYAWQSHRGVPQYMLTKIAFDAYVSEPGCPDLSVQDINNGRLPWVTIWGGHGERVSIPAGTPLSEFKRLVREADGTIYSPEVPSAPADGVVVSREQAAFAEAWERVKAGAAAHGTWAISLMTNNEETWTADVESLRTDGPTWMATEDTDLAALTALAEKLVQS